MAETTPTPIATSSVDPKTGYCYVTGIYHSLRPSVSLPPASTPLSITDYVLSLLRSSTDFSPSAPVLIDSATDTSLSYSDFLRRVHSLSSCISSILLPFSSSSARHVALILSPSSLHIPVLYFSLLSLNVVVSPANPLSTRSELTHLVQLARPSVIFCVSSMSSELRRFGIPLIILDSPEFDSMLTRPVQTGSIPPVRISQIDSAVILYSSGTTGRVKGVELTHRNFIALIAGMLSRVDANERRETRPVSLFTLPLFHVFGFFMLVRSVALAETLVLMTRFDFEKMLTAVEKYRVTYMPVSPPLVVAMVKSDLVSKYDLSSLEVLGCGGAPLGKEVAERFRARFPHVDIIQGYGLTETCGAASAQVVPEEYERHGSVGRLTELMEAKIVDPSTGESLPPGLKGELWLRGPTIMKGYAADEESTTATLDSDGWLKTGDLCYFDNDGFLYIVDRLKELIKYKGYQVPPAELERLLLSHPEIADAAVIPQAYKLGTNSWLRPWHIRCDGLKVRENSQRYPDEEVGQIPMAFVVRKPGSTITGAQVMDYVAKQVSPYKKIRRVSFVSSIPKNPSGKILRRELVNQALSTPSKL